jgi:hypothetical protein
MRRCIEKIGAAVFLRQVAHAEAAAGSMMTVVLILPQ